MDSKVLDVSVIVDRISRRVDSIGVWSVDIDIMRGLMLFILRYFVLLNCFYLMFIFYYCMMLEST